jgi:enolase-phosphatase E1
MAEIAVAAHTVVLDIEGTTSAAGFILGDLYAYARPRLGPWIDAHADDPETTLAVEQVRRDGGLPPGAPTADLVAVLHAWMDGDVKATPLKTLQGRIWAEGFARGELRSHFFGDVIPALRSWHRAGVRLAVYSSGSAASQRAWFAHSPQGDLTELICGFFDTVTAGPKKEDSSYPVIADALGVEPDRLLFLSDHPGELAAAHRAGWQTVAVRRPGEPFQDAEFPCRAEIAAFDALEIAAA